jgi:hypothetical protein
VLKAYLSSQLEFRHLGASSGESKFITIPDQAFKLIMDASERRNTGLVPIFMRGGRGEASFQGSKISLGAMGDSYYEYLLKQWLQSGKKEDRYYWEIILKHVI